MSDITFIIQIFASLSALCLSYAFLMAIIKKEHVAVVLRGEAVFTLVFSGIAFGLYYQSLVDTVHIFQFLSAFTLAFAVINALGLVIVHRTAMRNDGAVYPETIVKTTRLLGLIIFVSLLAHLSLQVASLAWG